MSGPSRCHEVIWLLPSQGQAEPEGVAPSCGQTAALCTPPRASSPERAASPAVLSLASALPTSGRCQRLKLSEWIPDQASPGKSTQTPSLPTGSKRMSMSPHPSHALFVMVEPGLMLPGRRRAARRDREGDGVHHAGHRGRWPRQLIFMLVEVNQEHGALRVEHIDEPGPLFLGLGWVGGMAWWGS